MIFALYTAILRGYAWCFKFCDKHHVKAATAGTVVGNGTITVTATGQYGKAGETVTLVATLGDGGATKITLTTANENGTFNVDELEAGTLTSTFTIGSGNNPYPAGTIEITATFSD